PEGSACPGGCQAKTGMLSAVGTRQRTTLVIDCAFWAILGGRRRGPCWSPARVGRWARAHQHLHSRRRRASAMRENRLRTLLNEGKPTFGTRVQSAWPTVTEFV